MKPRDIEIGREYINTGVGHEKAVYLGVGYVNRERPQKELVVIQSTDTTMIGARVVPIKDSGRFWSKFVPK